MEPEIMSNFGLKEMQAVQGGTTKKYIDKCNRKGYISIYRKEKQ
jgi:hypothetical protein